MNSKRITITLVLLSIFQQAMAADKAPSGNKNSSASKSVNDKKANESSAKDKVSNKDSKLKAELGWTLNQTGSYIGKQTMYIAPTGLRMSSDTLSTIIRNVDESVFLCSSKKKKFCRMTYKDWRKQFNPSAGTTKTVDSRQIKKGKVGEVAGLKAIQYFFSNIDNGKVRITEEYWCADPSVIPPKYTKALSDLANFPVDFGTPLRIIKINPNMSRITALDTISYTKAPIALTVFDYPEGYKQAKDEYSVLLDDSGL